MIDLSTIGLYLLRTNFRSHGQSCTMGNHVRFACKRWSPLGSQSSTECIILTYCPQVIEKPQTEIEPWKKQVIPRVFSVSWPQIGQDYRVSAKVPSNNRRVHFSCRHVNVDFALAACADNPNTLLHTWVMFLVRQNIHIKSVHSLCIDTKVSFHLHKKERTSEFVVVLQLNNRHLSSPWFPVHPNRHLSK